MSVVMLKVAKVATDEMNKKVFPNSFVSIGMLIMLIVLKGINNI